MHEFEVAIRLKGGKKVEKMKLFFLTLLNNITKNMSSNNKKS